MTIKESFGQTLQRIRQGKGLKQRDVAKKINMDFSYFSRLENDRFDSNATRPTIDKIADALECTPDERGELLAAAGRIDADLEDAAKVASENPKLNELFRTASRLSPEKIEDLLRQIQSELESKPSPKTRKK